VVAGVVGFEDGARQSVTGVDAHVLGAYGERA
jgi:hypothetical protein